jgi:hypothetical protein
MTYKDLTAQDVWIAFQQLLAENGTTTTLDIKLDLRDDGFHATQHDVAQFMYWHCQVGDLFWTFNGTFRTYYSSLQDALDAYSADDGEIQQTSWLGWLSTQAAQGYIDQTNQNLFPSNKVQPTSFNIVVTNTPDKGDWSVFDYKGDEASIFVTGTLPDDYEEARTAVRTFFSREKGIERERVGATILKS